LSDLVTCNTLLMLRCTHADSRPKHRCAGKFLLWQYVFYSAFFTLHHPSFPLLFEVTCFLSGVNPVAVGQWLWGSVKQGLSTNGSTSIFTWLILSPSPITLPRLHFFGFCTSLVVICLSKKSRSQSPPLSRWASDHCYFRKESAL